MHMYVHSHICISFLRCSDERARAWNLPSTPHPILIDMRQALGTKITLWLCSFFLCAQSVTACSGGSDGTMVVKNPSSFPILLGGDLRKCIGGSNTSAIWYRS